MAQTWHDLLFAHWPIESQVLQRIVPAQLPIDTYDSRCFVGVIPFHMSHIHPRGLPPLLGLSRFPELNVRTYVTLDGIPGVYFFSLDAASRSAVWTARRFYRLPYFYAHMSVQAQGDCFQYDSRRHRTSAEFRGRYRPTSDMRLREKGSLEHWLTERYFLYTVHAGNVFRAQIHHQPWPLQEAEAEVETNSVAEAAGILLPRTAPLFHFARKQEVLIWPLQRVR
jgi:uncharacterized protein